jgi:hypothetical protein
MIKNYKTAKDIDIMIITTKKKLNIIKQKIEKIQEFLPKKIHPIILTKEDFLKINSEESVHPKTHKTDNINLPLNIMEKSHCLRLRSNKQKSTYRPWFRSKLLSRDNDP